MTKRRFSLLGLLLSALFVLLIILFLLYPLFLPIVIVGGLLLVTIVSVLYWIFDIIFPKV